ncbi:DUF3679 domain-containing protein [Bacillus sp. FJAT-27445]|uniref:DUF3679 domain-containing protein n=1 Tax=Bacillus sp. FJAT-27445 TaxID=1679166 RepID=UPI0007435220|nr:DUF3679 domain-containing protein [Bacillus sp. FJAT-27445]
MKLFMLKCMGLAALMFALVLGGMQVANDGIRRTKGYEDPSFKPAVSIEKDRSGELTVAFMGGETAPVGIDRKYNGSEGTKTSNLFSSLGKALSALLTGATKAIIDLIAK